MPLDLAVDISQSSVSRLVVHGYELRDDVSGIFELTLEVTSEDPAIDMRAVVGKTANVAFPTEPFLNQITGIVRRGRQLSSKPGGLSRYELCVTSPIWLSTRRRDHRIFQDKSSVDIVTELYGLYGGRLPRPERALSGSPSKREYCVQYDETDHDFVTRILAEDGISWFFDPAKSNTFTVCDDTTVDRSGLPPIPYIPSVGAGVDQSGPRVRAVLVTDDAATSALSLRDLDFEKPSFILAGKATAAGSLFDNEADLERYEYAVGRFETGGGGDALARQILEEERAMHRTLLCETNFSLAAGSHFTIADHPRDDVSRDLFVVSTRTRVKVLEREQHEVSHVLVCIPGDTPYRPPRRDKPRIFGTQTAFVVGDEGEEIHVDKYGRVRVAFRWDRRDMTSGGPTRYVRVSQGWASGGFGMVLLPRVKDEVVVSYLDGDPDEPLIVGRVHNALSATPLNLPAEKTRSIWRSQSSPGGGGYNSIMMEDKAGAELLELHAQLDMKSNIVRHETATIGKNSSRSTGVDDKVEVGNDQTVSIGADQTLSVGGNQQVSVGGNQIFGISGNQSSTIGGNQDFAVAGNQATSAVNIGESGSASISEEAPLISANGTAIATVRGGAMAFISSGAVVGVQAGGTITASAPVIVVQGASISINASGAAGISAPTVTVAGATVNVNGGKVNVGGGAEVTLGGGTVNITGDGTVNIKGGTVKIG